MLGKLKSAISALRDDVVQNFPLKGAMVRIVGNGVGNPTISNTYNIASVVRTGVGVYRGTMTQGSFYGVDLLTNGVFTSGFTIVASANTDNFLVNFTTVSPGIFDCKVYEISQGAGIRLTITPYDILATDTISCALLLNVNRGRLPPP